MKPPHRTAVAVVIPALNEAAAIGGVLDAIPRWVSRVIVADNGSTDGTAQIARAHGARVVVEPRRGYGSACLAGLAAVGRPDIVVFLDADASDDPTLMGALVRPIVRGKADLVIGSRTLGTAEAGALTPQQRWGNALACRLMKIFWRGPYSDLGPFRAIRYASLQRLNMDDAGYGWTIQMQIRALRRGLRVTETPVRYRRRIGVSKISGTVRGVLGAGTKILYSIAREAATRSPHKPSARQRLIVFIRFPEPGKTKSRMIPALGPQGAADLQRDMTIHTLDAVREFAGSHECEAQVRFAGGDEAHMSDLFGADLRYMPQGGGDLGQRLHRAFCDAFRTGADAAIAIGSDCPDLDAAILAQAFEQLRRHDLVLGPAADGGYYLIGPRRPVRDLFRNIAWGSAEVFEQTRAAAAQLNLSVALLPELHDVDRPEDIPLWHAARK